MCVCGEDAPLPLGGKECGTERTSTAISTSPLLPLPPTFVLIFFKPPATDASISTSPLLPLPPTFVFNFFNPPATEASISTSPLLPLPPTFVFMFFNPPATDARLLVPAAAAAAAVLVFVGVIFGVIDLPPAGTEDALVSELFMEDLGGCLEADVIDLPPAGTEDDDDLDTRILVPPPAAPKLLADLALLTLPVGLFSLRPPLLFMLMRLAAVGEGPAALVFLVEEEEMRPAFLVEEEETRPAFLVDEKDIRPALFAAGLDDMSVVAVVSESS